MQQEGFFSAESYLYHDDVFIKHLGPASGILIEIHLIATPPAHKSYKKVQTNNSKVQQTTTVCHRTVNRGIV